MPRFVDVEQRPSGAFWESLTDKEKCVVLGFLLSLPTANVTEVKHGSWRAVSWGAFDVCSVCGCPVERQQFKYYYCPNCGAQMDWKADS